MIETPRIKSFPSNKRMPHPIPYQGSKRNIANIILSFIPRGTARILEPFAGSSAVTIAAAASSLCDSYFLNDINEPLIELWRKIIERPGEISKKYRALWLAQQGREREFYDEIRSNFNQSKRPELLLYLMARCVKASIRYNSNGEFNQSPDNRRRGRHPNNMENDIRAVSKLLKGKTELSSRDYRDILESTRQEDIIYMDPPYQGTCLPRDSRYIRKVEFKEFVHSLRILNKRGIPFIISYDAQNGGKKYGNLLPSDLNLTRFEINAGRSTQATLLGKCHDTIESLYISKSLAKNLPLKHHDLNVRLKPQLELI